MGQQSFCQPHITKNKVKLNPQVYYMQQYSPAKFHPDWSTFMRMAPKKLVFGL